MAYLKNLDKGKVSFMFRKCRFARIKNKTAAKLEQKAIVIGVTLRELILYEFDIQLDRIVQWPGSIIALDWLPQQTRTKHFLWHLD